MKLPPRSLLLLPLAILALFNCEYLFDIAPPEIEIIEPQEGITYYGIVPCSLKVTDNKKVEKVEVFFDGESKHIFTEEPFARNFEFAELGGLPQTLKIVAYDQVGNWSDSELRTSLTEEAVSTPDIPSGSSNGYIDTSYTYSTGGSISNAGHSIEYRFDWGGGSYSSWSSSTSASYVWSSAGTYSIKAQARCAIDIVVVSSWSDSKAITITIWSPTLIGSYDTPNEARDVFVSGGYAYVADNNSVLQIINVSNPASPTLAGTYDTPYKACGVFVTGGYAYVANYTSGLQIIDVSNPANPTLAGAYDTPTSFSYGVFVTGGYAYVADRGSGLQIVDVSNPASPTRAGSYDTPGDAWGVFVSGSYAYVADERSGLQIINVSNPTSPTLAGTYDTPDIASGVFVSGSYAYVADYESGLQVINVSNPASPTLVGTYDTPDIAVNVFVSGSYAYVADYRSGLQIVDVSNPANPTLAGAYNTPGNAVKVFVTGGYAYVADKRSGLQILDVSGLP